MTDELVRQFATYGGLAGILMLMIIAGMSFALRTVWKRYNELQDQFNKLQDRRVVENKEVAGETVKLIGEVQKAMMEMTTAMGALKDVVMMAVKVS